MIVLRSWATKLHWGLSRELHMTGVARKKKDAFKKLKNKKLESVGIGPDGRPLPIRNTRKLFPHMYHCIIVNQDGSSYHIQHEYPHHIITLPLDLMTLSEEQIAARNKAKRLAKQTKFIVEEEEDDDDWDHSRYSELIR